MATAAVKKKPALKRPVFTKQQRAKSSSQNKRVRPIGNVSIMQACTDKHLFLKWFDKPAFETWTSWFTFMRASFGLPMKPEHLDIFRKCTGRTEPPTQPVKEVYLCTGRRGGKSRVLALVAVYLACFYDWRPYLSPGEIGTVAIMACDRRQARTIFRYVYAFLDEVPMLRGRLKREPTKESIELKNNIVIEIQTASFRSVRGYALSLDTPIPTPQGFKNMGDICVGDTVFDEYGNPTKVTDTFDRMPDKAYRITFSDGYTIDADAEHQWVTWDKLSRCKYYKLGIKDKLGEIPPNWANWDCTTSVKKKEQGRPITYDFAPAIRNTEEIANSLYRASSPTYPNHAIPNCGSLQMEERALPLDPYLFGVWLADGTSTEGVISGWYENGDAQWMEKQFQAHGFTTRRCQVYQFAVHTLVTTLRKMDVYGTKRIPQEYLWASEEQRLALLQGIMDADGHIPPNKNRQVEFISVREEHANAVAFLARSLGQKPTVRKAKKTEGYCGLPYYYCVRWSATINPFRLPRKAQVWENARTDKIQSVKMRTITDCQPIDPVPMRCLTVDSPNSMYLCGENMIPTHNTIVAALMDEIAFFRSDESSNPDSEIMEAILPGMGTIPGSMMLCASSPYARKGVLYKAYRDYFGVDDPNVLFWKAPTWVMNPTLPKDIIERAYKRDHAKAASEYGAEFRKDVETAVSIEALDAATDHSIQERQPNHQHQYVAFVDASGGGKDSFTMVIGHAEGERRVIDYIYERTPPFSPRDVIQEICGILKQYHISYVTGDRYAGEFPREHFMENGVVYEISAKPKAELYISFISQLNSGLVRLLDNDRMYKQFLELERKTRAGGRDIIDHPPGGHDDIANSVAGVCVLMEYAAPADIW